MANEKLRKLENRLGRLEYRLYGLFATYHSRGLRAEELAEEHDLLEERKELERAIDILKHWDEVPF